MEYKACNFKFTYTISGYWYGLLHQWLRSVVFSSATVGCHARLICDALALYLSVGITHFSLQVVHDQKVELLVRGVGKGKCSESNPCLNTMARVFA